MITLINRVTEQVVELDEIGTFMTDISDPENWFVDGTELFVEPEPVVAAPVEPAIIEDIPSIPQVDLVINELDQPKEDQHG